MPQGAGSLRLNLRVPEDSRYAQGRSTQVVCPTGRAAFQRCQAYPSSGDHAVLAYHLIYVEMGQASHDFAACALHIHRRPFVRKHCISTIGQDVHYGLGVDT